MLAEETYTGNIDQAFLLYIRNLAGVAGRPTILSLDHAGQRQYGRILAFVGLSSASFPMVADVS